MGKKKDKAEKSKKKKSDKVSVAEPDTENIEYAEATPEAESIDYAEYVSTEDVMELVNSLDQNLDQLDKSTQSLQQQIARNQQTLQRQNTMFKIIALILVVGIITVGYSNARTNSRTTDNVDSVSANMNKMNEQIRSMNTTIGNMSEKINRLTSNLNAVSANVAMLNQSVSKLAADVSKINTDTTTQVYDPWRTARPMDRPWR